MDNLIPSCSHCNSRLKHSKKFTKNTHIHPYHDDLDSFFEFYIELVDSNYLEEDSFEIGFRFKDHENKKRTINHLNDFKIEERYKHHKNEIIEILKRVKFYNSQRLNEISKILKKDVSLHFLVFPDENCEINKTSLGKLKRDASKQLSLLMNNKTNFAKKNTNPSK